MSLKIKPIYPEDLGMVLNYHARVNRDKPEYGLGSVGTAQPREYADAIDRHWKTLGQTT